MTVTTVGDRGLPVRRDRRTHDLQQVRREQREPRAVLDPERVPLAHLHVDEADARQRAEQGPLAPSRPRRTPTRRPGAAAPRGAGRVSSMVTSVRQRWPPGRSTRAHSNRARIFRADRLITPLEMTASTRRLGAEWPPSRPRRSLCLQARPPRRWPVRWPHLGKQVQPDDLPVGPTRRAASSASMPPPQPTSSSVRRVGIPRGAAGCRRRDDRRPPRREPRELFGAVETCPDPRADGERPIGRAHQLLDLGLVHQVRLIGRLLPACRQERLHPDADVRGQLRCGAATTGGAPEELDLAAAAAAGRGARRSGLGSRRRPRRDR